jgi:integrase
MKHDIPFLTKTAKSGWYGYRRRVPKGLKHLFQGKSEIIKAFNTKNFDIAQIELRKMNDWFDEKVESHNFTKKVKGQLPFEQLRSVDKHLRDEGLHPDEMPQVSVHTSRSDFVDISKDALDAAIAKVKRDRGEINDEEYLALLKPLQGRKLWQMQSFIIQRDFLRDHLQKKYTDPEKLIDTGPVFERDDYIPPQLQWDESDPEVIQYRIMNNEPVNPPPTWQNALDNYLRQNLRKTRNPEQTSKHKKATISMAQKLATAFPDRMDTKLQDIEGDMIQNFAEQAWPNAPTRSKNLRVLRAIWRCWDEHQPKQKVGFDPFKPIVKATSGKVDQDEDKRRSFTPAEFKHFLESLSNETNDEIKLIGLIMAYCGAPTGEAAGLVRGDVKLKVEQPYIVFRNNKHRLMGKPRLERAIPLIDSLASQLNEYLGSKELGKDDLIFPVLGTGEYASGDRSKKLTKHIINMRDHDEKHLVPYSLRHTFIDRADIVGSPSGFSEYIVGHRTEGSSKIHANYGTGLPPARLVEFMHDTWTVEDWGMFEEFD